MFNNADLTANEFALKLAKYYRGGGRIISLEEDSMLYGMVRC
ncbi:MAG: hypothetical protein ACLTLQ_20935 [[Clostridium] scindens]